MNLLDLDRCATTIRSAERPLYRGEVDVVSGVLVEATGIPAAIGDLCEIDRGIHGRIQAEVIGFRGDRTLLMPHGDLVGLAPGQTVQGLGRAFGLNVSDEFLGRVVDGFGRPLDGRPAPENGQRRPIRRDAPMPLERASVDRPISTGVRAIDGLMTLGCGQRVGIFARAGVGKST